MRFKNCSGITMAVEIHLRRLNPEARAILEQGLKVHGLENLRDLPGIANPEMLYFFIDGTRDLLKRYGPEYIFKYRQLYLDQLEYLATLL